MKRDVEVFRKILMQVEQRPNGLIDEIHGIDRVEESELHGHVELLVEAGYLKATDQTSFGDQFNRFLLERITFEGHEFLDAIRHEGFIEELKSKARDEGTSLPLTILKELGTQFLRKKLGLN